MAGASYGSDLTMVHDIFEAIKLANGFLVTIILKPFRFEGRRRQDEVWFPFVALYGRRLVFLTTYRNV